MWKLIIVFTLSVSKPVDLTVGQDKFDTLAQCLNAGDAFALKASGTPRNGDSIKIECKYEMNTFTFTYTPSNNILLPAR